MSKNILSEAHKATDKQLARMESHIRAIYKRAGKGLDAEAKRIMAIFEKQDAAQKANLAAGAITQEQYDEWRERAFTQAAHNRRLADRLAAEVVNADKTATAYINGELPGIYALNINAVNQTIKNAVRGYSFELLDAHTVRNLIKDNPNLLPFKKVNGQKVLRWAKSKITREITQGILRGESIPKIAKRLEKVTGMDERYAVTNARTAVTSAENKGRLDGMEDARDQGVVLEKEWLATHDARTRDWHADLDGQRKDTYEPFSNDFGKIMYPGDPTADAANVYNCRCTLITHVKGFIGKNGYAVANNGYENFRHVKHR